MFGTVGRESVLEMLLAWGAHVHAEDSAGAVPGERTAGGSFDGDAVCGEMPDNARHLLVEHGPVAAETSPIPTGAGTCLQIRGLFWS